MQYHRRSLFLLVLLAGACQPRAAPEAQELNQAVALATTAAGEELAVKEYRLVGAVRMIHKGTWIWRVTFKPEHLLPENPSTGILGLGGELFVNVDPATGESTITYGE